MWPFRSKTQKKLDALQKIVNARRLVLAAALEVSKRTGDEFERLEPLLGDEARGAFVLAQGQCGYFIGALLDDVATADESIQDLWVAASLGNGQNPMLIAEQLAGTERRLAESEQTCRSLGLACTLMAHAVGLCTTMGNAHQP